MSVNYRAWDTEAGGLHISGQLGLHRENSSQREREKEREKLGEGEKGKEREEETPPANSPLLRSTLILTLDATI